MIFRLLFFLAMTVIIGCSTPPSSSRTVASEATSNVQGGDEVLPNDDREFYCKALGVSPAGEILEFSIRGCVRDSFKVSNTNLGKMRVKNSKIVACKGQENATIKVSRKVREGNRIQRRAKQLSSPWAEMYSQLGDRTYEIPSDWVIIGYFGKKDLSIKLNKKAKAVTVVKGKKGNYSLKKIPWILNINYDPGRRSTMRMDFGHHMKGSASKSLECGYFLDVIGG